MSRESWAEIPGTKATQAAYNLKEELDFAARGNALSDDAAVMLA